ncbi:MAG: hypothetical protein AB8F74_02275 [Saprospiraceae bacterium]
MANKTSISTILFLSAFFLLATTFGIYSYQQNNKLEKENKNLTTEVSDLEETREELLADVKTLEEEFEELATVNENQKRDLEAANKALTSNKAELKKLQKKYKKDIGWMRGEIKKLRAAKTELTAMVDRLKAEQAEGGIADGSLLEHRISNIEARNQELMDRLEEARNRNNLLERENDNLDVTATVATNTRVDIFKKGKKPTGSFRRAREIVVSFNLSHLAKSKEGETDLYVVIKDAKGNLVQVDNPVTKKITSEVTGKIEPIIAQQSIRATLYDKVRLAFKVEPKRRTLKKGSYFVFIYADWGLVGRTEFTLR